MDITEKKAFRKSFMGGFSKEDVNKYIEESTERYNTQLKEAEERFAAADRERVETAAKLSEAQSEIEKLTEKSHELELLTTKHEELKDSYDLCNKNLLSTEETLAAKNKELDEAYAKIAALSKIETEYTARKTELADIEIAARARAAAIIADAETVARAKASDFEVEISKRRADFDHEYSAAVNQSKETFDRVARMLEALKLETASIDEKICRVVDSARINASELSVAVSNAESKISNLASCFSAEE